MTSGSVFKTVVYFSLPYLLSCFLQTLYGMADLFIVGQFGGVSSTTAVSIGSQIMHMLTVMIVGLDMGSTVMIGRSIGAKNKRQAAECIGNTVTMFMGISMVLMAVLLVLVRPIVGIMSTPAEAVEGTVRYLTICFIGIPFITAYNIISSIFRGWGILRVRCILLRWHVRPISDWIICLLDCRGWMQPVLPLERRAHRQSV